MKKRDRLEILAEDIQSKFGLVLEGHAALDTKIERLGQDLGERIDQVDVQISALNHKIGAVDARLSAKIDAVDARLSAKIDAVDARLSAKIDAVDASLSAKLDAVSADLKAHRADTEVHRTTYRVSEPS